MNKTEFIKNLKAGDMVIIRDYYNRMYIERVTKVTPTGRIRINDTTFDQDGIERSSYWQKSHLIEYSEELAIQIKEKDERYEIIEELKKTNWNQFKLKDLRNIKEIINNVEWR